MKEKEKKEDIFSLRRKVRKYQEGLSFIPRLSWRLKEIRNMYDINSQDPEELLKLFQELVDISEDLHRAYRNQYPSRIGKEA